MIADKGDLKNKLQDKLNDSKASRNSNDQSQEKT